ncbi:MAG TPA: PASTA domain-containing protein [Flavobacteriaceae bacterium]|nr:PASTA domain-containing protein [Flavobacteriaceae bacterium]
MSLIRFVFSKKFLQQILIAGIVVIAIVFGLLWWLGYSTNHNQKLEVPDLSKLSLEEVEKVLEKNKMRYAILDSANYNPDYPPYSVMEQIPQAGAMVKENRKIYINLNPSDYPKLDIPEVLGKTLRQVEPTLLAMGFSIGTISYKPYLAEDVVLEMHHKGRKIMPGDRVQKTATIDLVVGDGLGSLDGREKEEETDFDSDLDF